MVAGDVHRELLVAGEPFCGLLGRQKNPFVMSLSICGLTLVHCDVHARLCVHTEVQFIYIFQSQTTTPVASIILQIQ